MKKDEFFFCMVYIKRWIVEISWGLKIMEILATLFSFKGSDWDLLPGSCWQCLCFELTSFPFLL